MKLKKGYIVEATEVELFQVYSKSEWYEIWSFPDYLSKMRESGCVIVDNPSLDGDVDDEIRLLDEDEDYFPDDEDE
jgi:hypothetical protein